MEYDGMNTIGFHSIPSF